MVRLVLLFLVSGAASAWAADLTVTLKAESDAALADHVAWRNGEQAKADTVAHGAWRAEVAKRKADRAAVDAQIQSLTAQRDAALPSAQPPIQAQIDQARAEKAAIPRDPEEPIARGPYTARRVAEELLDSACLGYAEDTRRRGGLR